MGRPRRPGKRRPDPSKPQRRSIWLTADLRAAIRAQAKVEERKVSDMIRILIQRGLRATRTPPPSSAM